MSMPKWKDDSQNGRAAFRMTTAGAVFFSKATNRRARIWYVVFSRCLDAHLCVVLLTPEQAYLGVTMITRLCNIVIRKAYLPE